MINIMISFVTKEKIFTTINTLLMPFSALLLGEIGGEILRFALAWEAVSLILNVTFLALIKDKLGNKFSFGFNGREGLC